MPEGPVHPQPSPDPGSGTEPSDPNHQPPIPCSCVGRKLSAKCPVHAEIVASMKRSMNDIQKLLALDDEARKQEP